jgi:hypothetical protein
MPSQSVVTAGLDPAVHVLLSRVLQRVDGRDKRGHDGMEVPRGSPFAPQ